MELELSGKHIPHQNGVFCDVFDARKSIEDVNAGKAKVHHTLSILGWLPVEYTMSRESDLTWFASKGSLLLHRVSDKAAL